ncbi:MAG: prephenate dehydrogenase, partial [Granulosicoccaceae bacterium]
MSGIEAPSLKPSLVIVGVGLIGGSLGLALREAGYVGEIVGAGSREHNLQLAVECGAIDRFDTDLKAAVSGASIVLLAVPMGAMRSVMAVIKDVLPADAVVTDAGSVKSSFALDARAVFADSLHRVVPGHPIAGSENSGVAAARANLFQSRRVILTPLPESSATAVQTVRELWQPTGAQV